MIRTKANQGDEILRVLADGDWVPLPRILQCAAQYNARIFELRRLGFRIVSKTRDVGGKRHSWFRLESAPPATGGVLEEKPTRPAAAASFPAFGNLAPESYRVD